MIVWDKTTFSTYNSPYNDLSVLNEQGSLATTIPANFDAINGVPQIVRSYGHFSQLLDTLLSEMSNKTYSISATSD